MFDLLVSRIALRTVSTVLGGLGMFHLFLSFVVPNFAATAIVLIATASAIVYFSQE
jgi:hypothetical protein